MFLFFYPTHFVSNGRYLLTWMRWIPKSMSDLAGDPTFHKKLLEQWDRLQQLSQKTSPTYSTVNHKIDTCWTICHPPKK
ncbi:hypothetical protein DPEC_G00032720 [Dallia pectoralis]|uniref:Uncharacterized protein n=1 Tax=Dallia pectoralis TaxID=75939 RepID=A0ACC2HDF7_DALPE|nr:hypothetical protein DPEC_G00032720 [Dallia pectoralis]